ncbi:MAG: hypothetical protein V4757_03760 [Pseudomonadota bacterium]
MPAPVTLGQSLAGLLLAGAGLLAMPAVAQVAADLAAAQARYDREMAVCNGGNLPAPQRDLCVRAAGAALDRARGGPPVPVEATTSDGRATVMSPESTAVTGSMPSSTSDLRITPDGRATVVPPSDGSNVRGSAPQ